MAGHRKFDKTISAWLEESASARLPGRVLDATFERTRRTRQEVGWRAILGRIQMPRFVLALGGAALAVVVGAVALNFFGSRASVGGPSSSPSPSPSPTAFAAATPAPRPFVLWRQNGITFTATIPSGWSGESGAGFITNGDPGPPNGAGLIVYAEPLYVYGDPCHWSTTRPNTPASTVDELVSALTAQASREASAPVDVSVQGYSGKSITLHVPDSANFALCDQGYFGSWVGAVNTSPDRYEQGPGQIDKLWILDVRGTPVVIDIGYYAGTPPSVISELEAIVASTTFG